MARAGDFQEVNLQSNTPIPLPALLVKLEIGVKIGVSPDILTIFCLI